MINFKSKKVLVMGLGLNGGGLGVTKFLVREGAEVTVTDLKSAKDLEIPLSELKNLTIKFVLGEHRESDFKNSDMIIRNPGVPEDNPYLKIARESNIPIEMEMGIFFDRLPSKKIIGVTGTKGKTTTTILIGKILEESKIKYVIAGNLRVSALELLPQIDKDTYVVLELSSWQLEGLVPHKTSPHIAVITNIFPDHLNRYKSFEDYKQAKGLIFKYQNANDYLVFNSLNPGAIELSKQAISKVIFADPSEKEIIDIVNSAIIPGEHNKQNIALAVKTAILAGAGLESVKNAVKKFAGVEHRLEFVREVNGIKYYNDTCATNPEAAETALKIFSKPIVWITGGADKNLDFNDLVKNAVGKVKSIILLEGSATAKIEAEINKYSSLKIAGKFNNLEQAIICAIKEANSGDIILLSPGCASFGMFVNEFDRGNQFKALVNNL